MSKVNISLLLVLGLAVPYTAMAAEDDEVTIRVIGADENTTGAVTNRIKLPDPDSDSSAEDAQVREQHTGDNSGAGETVGEGFEEMGGDTIQDMERAIDQEHNDMQNDMEQSSGHGK